MTMKRQLVLALVMALASVFGPAVPPAVGQEGVSAGASGGGAGEGIKVRGYWTIEVRNPDGTLVRRQEFENALRDTGRAVLAGVLKGVNSPGLWTVNVFGNPPGSGACDMRILDEGFLTDACRIAEATSALSADSRNLTKSGSPLDVTLSGSFTAVRSGNVGAVATGLGFCGSGVAPSACHSSATLANPFSAVTLGQPIPVQQGQIVQVTVVFSFPAPPPAGS
jgi:hypothetical protein